MILTDTEIKSKQLIQYASEERLNSTSYDLGIGEIITSDGKRVDDAGYAIKPQEIVWLVSRENVKLPSTITAHASIRTSLCNNGILALNIGIVDPCWSGPLATAIVNFSKRDYYLTIEEKFLRLSFFQHNEPEKTKPTHKIRGEYIVERMGTAKTVFGDTFLDFDAIKENISSEIINKRQNNFIYTASIAALCLAFFTIFISVVAYTIPIFNIHPSVSQSEIQNLVDDLEDVKSKIDDLSRKNTKNDDASE